MSNNKQDRIAVIGLGNTLRRDDGIGIHILALLQEKFKHNKKISFLNFGIASFGLLNYFDNFKKVLLIDAIEAGFKPATLKIFKLQDASYEIVEKKISSHELTLSDLFRLYQMLKISADVYVAGIQVKDTSYGLEMSSALEKAQSRVVEELSAFIASF
jgi:hydrogenase maturation protease